MAIKKTITKKEVQVPANTVKLGGILTLAPQARGIVLFAHGSGSSHKSPRNQQISQCLVDAGFGTLLFDLLTLDEEKEDMMTRELRFNIPFLSYRLSLATEWAQEQFKMNIGYFGASTGAAAAIMSASELGSKISAVVSRGGRPDLAGESLARITVPTLLIVGGADYGVIELNKSAYEMMSCVKKLEIVPNATHLFEEPGTLEEVGKMATHWFEEYTHPSPNFSF